MRWAVVLAALAACAEPYSNEDLLFVRAVPDPAAVALELPREGMAAEPSRIAQYYLQMVDISQSVNKAIFDPLGTVNEIASNPPNYRDVDVRAWGPIVTSTFASVTLYMVRTATPGVRVPTATTTIVPIEARIDFVMSAAVRDGPPFTVMTGAFAAIGDSGSGIGGLTVDLDAYRRVDPRSSDGGRYSGAYDDRDGQRVVFGWVQPSGGSAYYQLERGAAGVRFGVVQRLEVYAPGDVTPSALERLTLLGRWRPDNRGQADIEYAGGDLVEPLHGHECWDEQYRRVYFAATAPQLGPGEGSFEACPPE